MMVLLLLLLAASAAAAAVAVAVAVAAATSSSPSWLPSLVTCPSQDAVAKVLTGRAGVGSWQVRSSPDFSAASMVRQQAQFAYTASGNATGERLPPPCVLVMVTSTAGVQAAVRAAAALGLRVVARSGRHAYTAFSWGASGALVVDVRGLRSWELQRTPVPHQSPPAVSLSTPSPVLGGHVWIGAGWRLAEVYARLGATPSSEDGGGCGHSSPQALWLPGGTCPSVSAAGLAAAGGHGWLHRYAGLTADNVVAAEVVLANGTTLVVGSDTGDDDDDDDAHHHDGDAHAGVAADDLLWAVRGGGNAGLFVITRLRLRVYADQVAAGQVALTNFSVHFDTVGNLTRAAALVSAFQDAYVQRAIPDEVYLSLNLYRTSVSIQGAALGVDAAALRKGVLAPFYALAAPSSAAFDRPASIYDLTLNLAGCKSRANCLEQAAADPKPGDANPLRFTAGSFYVSQDRPLAPATVERLVTAARDSPISGTYIMFDGYGGRVRALASDATAFGHRDALYHIQALVYFPHGMSEDVPLAVETNITDVLRPTAMGAYRNYPSLLLREPQVAYYGAKHASRLAALKCDLDPHNRFAFRQSIDCNNH